MLLEFVMGAIVVGACAWLALTFATNGRPYLSELKPAASLMKAKAVLAFAAVRMMRMPARKSLAQRGRLRG